MNRTPAIIILLLFAAAGLGLVWWGLSQVAVWSRALVACTPQVVMDTNTFWFLGGVSVAVLPLLALIKDKYHSYLFVLMIIFAFALPGAGYFWISSQANKMGYDVTALPSLFSLQAFTLANPVGCGG